MEMPGQSIDLHHAGCDDSSETIFVEGEAPAGQAACLMPRRYRKQPDWWVVELVGVEAPTHEPQTFRLVCSSEGLWGTEGIEILAPDGSLRLERPAAEEPPADVSTSGLASRLKSARRVGESDS
jgi:hypothetical protein